MQKYARIVDRYVLETFTPPERISFSDCFHPAIASQFLPCPTEVQPGWWYDGKGFAPPPAIELG